MNSLVVRNNDNHHYKTRQNHHLRVSRPTCKTVVNTFTNKSFQIWNAISSKVNINESMYKFKYHVKLFLLENELMITYLKLKLFLFIVGYIGCMATIMCVIVYFIVIM